jgi:hypothetical protein
MGLTLLLSHTDCHLFRDSLLLIPPPQVVPPPLLIYLCLLLVGIEKFGQGGAVCARTTERHNAFPGIKARQ